MLLLVLILVLIAFGLLVVALLTGSVLWAWVSVGVSVAAAAVLLIDWMMRRSAVRAGSDAVATTSPSSGGGVGSEFVRSRGAESEPVTEVLPVLPTSGAGRGRSPVAPPPEATSRLSPPAPGCEWRAGLGPGRHLGQRRAAGRDRVTVHSVPGWGLHGGDADRATVRLCGATVRRYPRRPPIERISVTLRSRNGGGAHVVTPAVKGLADSVGCRHRQCRRADRRAREQFHGKLAGRPIGAGHRIRSGRRRRR